MNKKIKRIISVALAISTFSLVEPTKYLIMATEAHASDVISVYLKTLSLNKSDIDFSQDTFFYNVNINQDVDEIKITAKPKSSNATVTIDNNYVDENDKYKYVVSLERGNNTVKVKVSNDEGEYKVYTLNIVRGEADQDDIYLQNIILNTENISFLQEKSSYYVKVNESVDKITIGAVPEQDFHEVTIDGAKANKEDNYKQTVDLNKGKNQIIIKVKNKKNEQRTYTLNITRKNSLDTKETQDDIYLDYIKVEDKAINIDKNKTIYDLDLDENTEQIDLRIEPESIKYKVEINDEIVEDVDNYTDTIIIKPGRNEVKIKLQDEANNKQRIYTLNINRGVVASTNSTNTGISTKANDNRLAFKYNQWVQVNNKWQYNDATGNPLKNVWFYDKNSGKNYYLQADGNMATGWLLNNRYWYYLDERGARQLGWQLVNKHWYYLDAEGIMKTGWIRDLNGKDYYLQSNGVMAKNTKINGFKLGNDGSCYNV